MKIAARLFVLLAISILAAHAWFPRGSVPTDPNACGVSANTWCVGSDGWTVFSGTVGSSGTACSNNATSTWNGTCIFSVTSAGSDISCQADPLVAGMSSATLSSYVPPHPCATLQGVVAKMRNNKDDWLVLHKGEIYQGSLGGTTGTLFGFNGFSIARPMLVGAYGTGARPTIEKTLASGDNACYSNQALQGSYMAVVGLRCWGATSDPSSAQYHGGTFTGTISSGSPTISAISPALPSTFSDYSSKILIEGNGIWAKSISGNPGGTNSITMTSNATLSGPVTFQLNSLYSQTGFQLTGVINLLIVEDCEFDYAGISVVQNTSVGTPTDIQFRIRRNIFNHSYESGNSANIFLSGNYPYPDAYTLIEDNVFQYGGWEPAVWAFYGAGNTHCLYLHDPAPAYNLKNNIISHCSSTGVQWREAGTGYDNLFTQDPIQWSSASDFHSGNYSYNVYSNSADLTCALRSATAIATSGSSISIDGVPTNPNCSSVINVTNLTNPGSIPTNCQYSSTTSTTQISMTGTGCTIQPGARGDGVQVGDKILLYALYGWGVSPGAAGGLYISAGPALCNIVNPGSTACYGATSTVSLAGAASSAITVTEPDTHTTRQNDEIFKFTSGTLPTGLSLSTDYCSTNVSGLTYNIYLPTNVGGTNECLGGSAIINSDGSTGSAAREGSRLFNFTVGDFPNWPAFTVPTWVTAGMAICTVGTTTSIFTDNPSISGCTFVSYVSSDRLHLITTGGATNSQLAGNTQYQLFVPENANNPTYTVTPNEVFVNSVSAWSSTAAAVKLQDLYGNNINFSNAYIYNWNPGGNASAQISNIGFLASSNNVSQVSANMNVAGSSAHPRASVEAYDASVAGRTATITIAPSGTGTGGVATVSAGSLTPGDTLFAADGSNTISQYQKVLSQLTSTTYAVSVSQTVSTPTAVLGGSQDDFLANASLQSHDAGWNPTWTANSANNYIRSALQCGNQTTYPGSPACPAQ